jgi:hypothetical protein
MQSDPCMHDSFLVELIHSACRQDSFAFAYFWSDGGVALGMKHLAGLKWPTGSTAVFRTDFMHATNQTRHQT